MWSVIRTSVRLCHYIKDRLLQRACQYCIAKGRFTVLVRKIINFIVIIKQTKLHVVS